MICVLSVTLLVLTYDPQGSLPHERQKRRQTRGSGRALWSTSGSGHDAVHPRRHSVVVAVSNRAVQLLPSPLTMTIEPGSSVYSGQRQCSDFSDTTPTPQDLFFVYFAYGTK
jgi:hypothetical protein